MPRPLPDPAGGSGGSFISKPARGWLHSDQLITKDGITYAVRYIGCLEVNTSMKTLDFDTRSQIAKECISRVCEAAGLKTVDKKRKVDKRVSRAIGDRPLMDHAGANVNLTVSSTCLVLTAHDTGQVIAKHEMPRISFASGGDPDTLDFVAYVAKDLQDWRACYVLECGGGLAQNVITTVGQAFELRFKQYLQHPPGYPFGMVEDRDYYNDLPGKVPPDAGPPPVPPLPSLHHHTVISVPAAAATAAAAQPSTSTSQQKDIANLIDFHSELISAKPGHEYVNDVMVGAEAEGAASAVSDVFDLKHLGNDIGRRQSPTSQRSQLQMEVWFHGFISRQQAESLLTKDGEFLVRESQGSAGQYVLTGMQGGIKKHLLLIDPEGVVRTKDRMFESVSHLIIYHVQNQLPIISAESALVLRTPVPKPLTSH